jgi:hypothetical protein
MEENVDELLYGNLDEAPLIDSLPPQAPAEPKSVLLDPNVSAQG